MALQYSQKSEKLACSLSMWVDNRCVRVCVCACVDCCHLWYAGVSRFYVGLYRNDISFHGFYIVIIATVLCRRNDRFVYDYTQSCVSIHTWVCTALGKIKLYFELGFHSTKG